MLVAISGTHNGNQPKYYLNRLNTLVIIKHQKWKSSLWMRWVGTFSNSVCIRGWILLITRTKQDAVLTLFLLPFIVNINIGTLGTKEADGKGRIFLELCHSITGNPQYSDFKNHTLIYFQKVCATVYKLSVPSHFLFSFSESKELAPACFQEGLSQRFLKPFPVLWSVYQA